MLARCNSVKSKHDIGCDQALKTKLSGTYAVTDEDRDMWSPGNAAISNSKQRAPRSTPLRVDDYDWNSTVHSDTEMVAVAHTSFALT